jgi:hypothetical protein
VYGKATGTATALNGNSAQGYGVYGYSDSGQAMHGGSNSNIGVFGGTTSSTLPAVQGWAKAGNTGVQGHSGSAAPTVTPSNTGVFGSAPSGRGGQFSGGKAQLRLIPSNTSSHPAAGEAGDLFLDKTARLWLCTVTGSPATWKRVSLV